MGAWWLGVRAPRAPIVFGAMEKQSMTAMEKGPNGTGSLWDGRGDFLNAEGWRGEGGAGKDFKVTGISGCKENRKRLIASHVLCASALTNSGMGEGTFLNAEG